jgi:Flp pilus assembly protein TadG
MRRRDRAGTVAVEFALVSFAFIGLLLFVLQLGFRLYAQIALDFATSRAARQLQVNATQTLTASLNTFRTVTFCPLLAPMLTCANVLITLRRIAQDYLNDSQANPPATSGTLTQPATFTPGASGALMLLQVSYVGPIMTWPLSWGSVATYNGTTGSVIVSSMPYENEY